MTWLYRTHERKGSPLTSSAFVRGSAGSNSELTSHDPIPESCAASSPQSEAPSFSSEGCGRGSSTTLPSGRTFQPSTASPGGEGSISSAAASRVSPFPTLAVGSVAMTRDISGPPSPASSGKSSRNSASSRTSRPCYEWASCRSTMTFSEWASELRRDSSRRRKSAHPTSGSASSSWPTPTALDGSRTAERPATWLRRRRKQLDHLHLPPTMAVQFWTAIPPNLTGWTWASLPDLLTRSGIVFEGPSTPPLALLNPAFSERLMGLPSEWTGFGPSETQFALWQRRMRSEYCRLLC
jgi:hypothetical protein